MGVLSAVLLYCVSVSRSTVELLEPDIGNTEADECLEEPVRPYATFVSACVAQWLGFAWVCRMMAQCDGLGDDGAC